LIQTYEQLKEWFVTFKIPLPVAHSELAMRQWERAIVDPTMGKIYSFWCCAGMDRYISDRFAWSDIQKSVLIKELF
jgi:hypothetical protein